mmetsp:Transcript_53973/g.96646  ORF Transcript_53973/g.96646 Transcript_53973/m.96646 type:complete len:354 (+) Transcript_53973:30-1091(+)
MEPLALLREGPAIWYDSAPLCSSSSLTWGSSAQVPASSSGALRVSDPENWQVSTDLLKERTAMILGMNPRALRKKLPWNVYMWPKRRHWALVLQPAGEPFAARIVDDFVHNPHHCYSAEVDSNQFFLVYELLLDENDVFLLLSVKPDFEPDRPDVRALGTLKPTTFLELEAHALTVVSCYRGYSFIGCNCQHFATDLATSLGTPTRIRPDDEALALAASDNAATVGVVGACVAVTALAGAAGAPALTCAPVILTAIAASALSFGLIGVAALMSVAGVYQTFHEWHRRIDVKEGVKLFRGRSTSIILVLVPSRPPRPLTYTCMPPIADGPFVEELDEGTEKSQVEATPSSGGRL